MRTALALLDRHGVVTREAVAAEAIDGGFSARLPRPPGDGGGGPDPARLLRRRARGGPVRAGRGDRPPARASASRLGAGRAAPSTCSRPPIRPTRTAPRSPWPRRGEDDRRPFQRAAGAYVVLVDGVAALYVDRGGGSLQTLPAGDDPEVGRARRSARWAALVADGRVRELVITKVDGEPVAGRRSATTARRRVRRRLSRAGPARGLDRAGPRWRTARRDRASPVALEPALTGARSMPEGDTLHRTAAGLAPAPRRPRRHRGARPRPGPQVERIVGATITAVEAVGQEPPDPVRQRPRAPDAPPDERVVAPLPAGRALAPARGAGPAGPRGPGRRRRLLRRPGRRAVRDRAPRRIHPALATPRARPARPGVRTRRRGRGVRRLRDPGPRRPDDRRGAARPAGARRDRQRLAERDPVRRAGRPVRAASGDLDDATLGRLVGDRPTGLLARRASALAPRPRADARLRPGRSAVPALRDADPVRAAGRTAMPRTTYWCPACQAGAG